MDYKYKIKISTINGGKPFIKQLPSLKPVWGNCEFYINENIEDCDMWVVYGGLEKSETTKVPEHMTIFITTEPETIHKYKNKFLKQFHTIITGQKNIKHRNVIYSQQSLPWWVGHKVKTTEDKYYKTYDELKSIENIEKDKLASIIVSNKTFTNGHKKRFQFLNKLKNELGDKIDIYGIGNNTIDDKWDAIAPYKYHIVIENYSSDDYFTEKLADAFLGQSYPIYYGCKNIYDYFPLNSISQIDINDIDKTISEINNIIDSNKYDQNIAEIKKAKDLILDKYQIFPILENYINTHKEKGGIETITLYPEKDNWIMSFLRKIKKIILKNWY